MAERLDGTVALVTGASSGIGAATALELASRGASVALVVRRGARGGASRAGQGERGEWGGAGRAGRGKQGGARGAGLEGGQGAGL